MLIPSPYSTPIFFFFSFSEQIHRFELTMNDVTLASSKINLTRLLTHDGQRPTERATFIGAIFAFVFIFAGLIGNLLLITTILSVKKLRSNIINIFIVSVSALHSIDSAKKRKNGNFPSMSNSFLRLKCKWVFPSSSSSSSCNSMTYWILVSINFLSDFPMPIEDG